MKAKSMSIRILTHDNQLVYLNARDVNIQYSITFPILALDPFTEIPAVADVGQLSFKAEGQMDPEDTYCIPGGTYGEFTAGDSKPYPLSRHALYYKDPGLYDEPCVGCGKYSRITTAGCDYCDYEDK